MDGFCDKSLFRIYLPQFLLAALELFFCVFKCTVLAIIYLYYWQSFLQYVFTHEQTRNTI